MKIRLFAGTINRRAPEEGWRNVHLDVSPRPIHDAELDLHVQPEFVGSVTAMPQFRAEMFDEVVMHHVLEHLTREEAGHAAREVHRVLVPGGLWDIEVPNMDAIAEAWVNGDHTRADLQQWIHGEPLASHEPGDSHRYSWSPTALSVYLMDAGFDLISCETPGLLIQVVAEKPTQFPRTAANA